MGKFEKGFRMLNETELNEIHGGRRTGGQEETRAYCMVDGCGWSSGWKISYTEVEQLIEAHKNETGHNDFLREGCVETG